MQCAVVSELVHESNIVFLREKCHGSASDKLRQEAEDGLDGDATTDFFDWPLLAAGCIYSHSLLDALTVQAIFNPDIISFWEAVTGTGQRGRCSSSPTDKLSECWECHESKPCTAVSTLASLGPMKSMMKVRRSLSEVMFFSKNEPIRSRVADDAEGGRALVGGSDPVRGRSRTRSASCGALRVKDRNHTSRGRDRQSESVSQVTALVHAGSATA